MIQDALDILNARKLELHAQITELDEKRAPLLEELRTIDRMFAAAGKKETKPKRDRSKSTNVSDEKLQKVLAVFVEDKEQGYTAGELANAAELNLATIRNAIKMLDERGLLVKVGSRPTERGVPPIIWRYDG